MARGPGGITGRGGCAARGARVEELRPLPPADPDHVSRTARAAGCSPGGSGGSYWSFGPSARASQIGRLPSDCTHRIGEEVTKNLLISPPATISVSTLPLTPPYSGV